MSMYMHWFTSAINTADIKEHGRRLRHLRERVKENRSIDEQQSERIAQLEEDLEETKVALTAVVALLVEANIVDPARIGRIVALSNEPDPTP